MRMKNTALFAIGLLSVHFGLLDGAECQTSLAPPLARPAPAPEVDASPPAVILATPPTATDDVPPPRATAKRAAPPVAARDAPPPKPAADHDGFTTGVEDEPVQKLPDLSRTAKRSKSIKEPDGIAGRRLPDSPEDEAVRRKMTICRDCK
jgi:hypothetical protein